MTKRDDDSPLTIPSGDRRRKLAARSRAILRAAASKKTLWEVADDYALEALVELRHALMTGNQELRFAAADKLAAIWTRMPPRPAIPPERGVTPEEWRERADGAARDENCQRFMVNHPAMQAAMVAAGWTPPEGWTPPKQETAN